MKKTSKDKSGRTRASAPARKPASGSHKGGIRSPKTSESRALKKASHESDEELREIIDNLNDVVYFLDTEGRLIYVSQVIKTVLGYEPADVVGVPFSDIIHPPDLPTVLAGFKSLLKNRPRPFDYRVVAKSGEIRWVRTSSHPVVQDGKAIGISGVLRDITDYKRIDMALRQSEERFRMLFETSKESVFLHSRPKRRLTAI